jgi:hypothetical protein
MLWKILQSLETFTMGGTFILILALGRGWTNWVFFQIATCTADCGVCVFGELTETLWTLGENGPLYDLVRLYKSAQKVSSIYWVYYSCKGFTKLSQKLEVSLMTQ